MSTQMKSTNLAKGFVLRAFGNLLQVRFEGHIKQGEVAFVQVGDTQLKSEVIEIAGDIAKIQVYEDTREVFVGTEVHFTGNLLEAELGPGLLSSVFDGLQNPLERVGEKTGVFLSRGVYLQPLNREVKWSYTPKAKVGDILNQGDNLGSVPEGRFTHQIMLPFNIYSECTITWVIDAGEYNVDTVIAKAIGANGKEHELTMVQTWPVKSGLLIGERVAGSKMMDTGSRIVDTQVPIMKGGTFCTPGPFGAGKTVLQHHLSKYSSVDIVVVVACGERAGEVVEILQEFPELIDPHTGETLMKRTSIICNTSSMPVAAREASIYMGITIAEYYRQMGLDILMLADSTSRWAQALREMSGRLEEIPGEEAFPAYLSSRIAAFYERAGSIALKDGNTGSVTIGGTVSPAGGNFEEPVTQSTLAVVGAFHGLSRARSDARRYPAIDPLTSWSKYIDVCSKELEKDVENWGKMVRDTLKILKLGDEIGKRMEVVGEEGTALKDLIIYLKSELYDFSYLQQNAFDKEDAYCPLERQKPLFVLINKIFGFEFSFSSHDEARGFFLGLQNDIKNMNFVPFDTDEYKESMQDIENKMAVVVQA